MSSHFGLFFLSVLSYLNELYDFWEKLFHAGSLQCHDITSSLVFLFEDLPAGVVRAPPTIQQLGTWLRTNHLPGGGLSCALLLRRRLPPPTPLGHGICQLAHGGS